MVYTLAVNILTAAGVFLTTGFALPITLGIVSLGLLVYHVDTIRKRRLAQKIALDWEPICRQVLAGNYSEADTEIKTKLNVKEWIEIQKDSVNSEKDFEKNRDDLASHFPVAKLRCSSEDTNFFNGLATQVATLKTIQLISNDPKNDVQEPMEYIHFFGSCHSRNGDRYAAYMEKLCLSMQKEKLTFNANSIDNMEKFLLDQAIEQIATNSNELKGGDWVLEYPLAFFRRLRDFGEGMQAVDNSDIKALLKCKSLDELYNQATSIKNRSSDK